MTRKYSLVIEGALLYPEWPLNPDNAKMKAWPKLIFEVTQETDGGYCAECLTLDIFTQGETWHELRSNVREAVRAYFFAYFIDGPHSRARPPAPRP